MQRLFWLQTPKSTPITHPGFTKIRRRRTQPTALQKSHDPFPWSAALTESCWGPEGGSDPDYGPDRL